jgi:cyclic beta-1,2-glucan synthetase
LTVAVEGVTHDYATKDETFELQAGALAAEQAATRRPHRATMVALDVRTIAAALEQAKRRWTARGGTDDALRVSAEWFLDNYYLLRRVALQLARDLPRGFLAHLPVLASGPQRGLPRVQALARALVVGRAIEVDGGVLQRFILAYGQVTPLSIAELWALPTMLRFCVLDSLVRCLRTLRVVDRIAIGSNEQEPSEDPATGPERAIRSLRLLSEIEWKVFFERNCRVEAILREDPALTYSRMDFETCDSYRRAVEDLAWNARTSEEAVATRAVALARGGMPDERRGHVGYYLVGEGRPLLEAPIGYRPTGLEWSRRALRRWPTFSYLLALAVSTAAPLLLVGEYVRRVGARPEWSAAALLLAFVPASAIAVSFVQWALAHLLAPRALPKLDFEQGLPDDARTLIAIPSLLGRAEEVDEMLQQVERHFVSNPDRRLQFALLTDDMDSRTTPLMAEPLERAVRGIVALNAKHGRDGVGPFHLLHREPLWNPSEQRFIGWERKRGKLEELNRLLRGDENTSYVRRVGNPKGLERIRFVITLDSDTHLPMGSARRLVGLLAHPLNRAVFDDAGRVVSGYAVVQPRIETSPAGSRATRFSTVYAGDVGFDIYSHATSDSYQDLFGSGIYVGKGIYDVDAFVRSLAGRVPENAVASHDLLEGVHARTALASDIVLFEDYPLHYAAYARRMHRWLRGDWQLLPWLLARVPSASGGKLPNPLTLIDRWKIADNLRRSLAAPLLLLFLVAGWSVLPGAPLVWTLGVVVASLVPLLPAIMAGRGRATPLARGLLELAFLPHTASVVVDAVARVCVRMFVTRRHMLQWTSAANTARGLHGRSARGVLWREMMVSPIAAVGLIGGLAWIRPSALLAASPLLLGWLVAPELARWLSQALSTETPSLRPTDRKRLRLLARRTWLFFETFVGPGDQWLPVDNHQMAPHEQTAHRTSPTNIGMMMLSTLAAYDLGYLGPSELSLRLRSAFESIARLEHYQGHLLNWYETKALQPLLPRYVSTVDSGNFAGCLLALEQGCREIARAPVVRGAAWDGLIDSLDLLDGALVSSTQDATTALRVTVSQMRAAVRRVRSLPNEAHETLRALCDELGPEFDRRLATLLGTGLYRFEADALDAIRTWTERLHHQLRQMRREIETLLPWLAWGADTAAQGLEMPSAARLDEIPDLAHKLDAALAARERDAPEAAAAIQRLRDACQSAGRGAATLGEGLLDLAARAAAEASGMDFRLLFDAQRKLFSIGFNVTIDKVDTHHYDLLASEARLASYLAVVRREVPQTHWYTLGRPMTRSAGTSALLSWGGTMFEYLMPCLLMRSHDGTLLSDSCKAAVQLQIAYGRESRTPWGISESAFDELDAHQTYQYRSFGVPGLGLKRGLGEDRVVAPYASALALSIQPRAVLDNMSRLEEMGMLGTYGFYEAIDFKPDAATSSRSRRVVASYMAHHQGMVLVAIDNVLTEEIMVDRFHAHSAVEAGAFLLNERAPAPLPADWSRTEHAETLQTTAPGVPSSAPEIWSPPPGGRPQALLLSNGRLSSLMTDSGAGGLRWQGLAATHYAPDPTRASDGACAYLRDERTGRVWPATSHEGRTTFSSHNAEFHMRQHGVSVRVDVTVGAVDDVEVRLITLHNETDRPRSLTVATAAEPVLIGAAEAARHPAFARMFVETELLSDLDALLVARRLRSPDETPAILVHRLVHDGSGVGFAGYETDRAAFFGRRGIVRSPEALTGKRGYHRGRTGDVLDPIVSVMARVELKPEGTATLAFVTSVGPSRSAALELARRYGSMHAVRWAFRDAEQESARRLQRARVRPGLLPSIHRLLSVLLFGEPALRVPQADIAAGQPCKARLWGRGISGDHPIVVVRVHDAASGLVGEVVSAQRFLRECGERLDLVFMDEAASSYVTDGAGTLQDALVRHGASNGLEGAADLFVVATDQLSDDDRRHLVASARVVLDTRDGALAANLYKVADRSPPLPRLGATRVEDRISRPVQRPELAFDNGTGGFTPDGTEYVISVSADRAPPAPWCNVLANDEFGCLVSESSLGCTWSLNSGENRLTPWRNDPVFDTPSEVLYLRDEETGAVWSPTPLPAGRDADVLVRHGAGYTTYASDNRGLEQRLTIFVPPDAPLKVARLTLKNTLPRGRRITATYYAEWVLGTLREEQRAFITSELEQGSACLLATCSWNAEFAGRVAFLASELAVHGFAADRTEFLGRRGDYARPEALERWGLAGSSDVGVDPCGALQVHLELAPGEQVETHFVLGQADDRAAALELVRRFRDRSVVDASWNALHRFWDGITGSIRVSTPEPAMDLMLNRWLLYQSLAARLFGRTGFYQSSGAFGFRDQLQDVMALFHGSPARARAHLLEASTRQFEEGDVLHWWHPPSGRGVRTRCSDDLLWLPFVTAEYVLATGDAAVLSEQATFLVGAPLRLDERDRYAFFETGPRSASLFEHCRRALEHASTQGSHGLPLMGDGDWNDGMNRVGCEGRGESVWLGWFLYATMTRFAVLCERMGERATAVEWRTRAASLGARVEASAWDGGWYVRAYDDDGVPLGSASGRECQIDSIAQSWAVLSGAAAPARARTAVHAADELLVREQDRLALLLWPPFDSALRDPGYIRAYPPGVRENGGQYTHAATWLGWAHVDLGDGENAARVFRVLNPILATATSKQTNRYRVEPYVLAGDVYSCPPWTGRGGWTWYTGAAAWAWRLGVEGILGLRKQDGQLSVDPCIPPRWKGFEAWVRIGDNEVHVIVENPEGVSSGVVSITLDGVPLDSSRIRIDSNARGLLEVRARLGRASPSVQSSARSSPGAARGLELED